MKDKFLACFSGDQRTVQVKKNVIGSLLIKGISIITSFLLVPLTINYVSPDIYGVWLTLSSILIWIGFLDLGFSQGLKNKLAEALANGDIAKGKGLVSTTYFIMAVIFIPTCIIAQFLIPHIDWAALLNVNPIYCDDISQAMHAIIGLCCVQFIINVLTTVIAAYQRVALSNSFNVTGNIVALIVIFILSKTVSASLLLLSIVMAAIPILVVLVASFILYRTLLKQVAPSIHAIERKYIGNLFNLGYKFFIINIQIIILYQSTNVMISYVSSPLEVTHYNLAYKYLNIAMMIFTIITAPLWPAYTDAYTRKDFAWMRRMHKKMQCILLYSIGGCALLTLCSEPFYHIWVGDAVHVPFTMTLLVALYVCIYCSMNLNSTLVVGIGKIEIHAYIVLIGMIGHIPLSLFLSKIWGTYGVLASMIFINLIYAVVFHIQVKKLLSNTATGIWNK